MMFDVFAEPAGQVVTEGQVEAVERFFAGIGEQAPATYKRLIVSEGGKYLDDDHNAVRVATEEEIGIDLFLHFDPQELHYYLPNRYQDTNGVLPDRKLVPIAILSINGELCLDYRELAGQPRVVFYDYDASEDEALIVVADDFDQLLTRLTAR